MTEATANNREPRSQIVSLTDINVVSAKKAADQQTSNALDPFHQQYGNLNLVRPLFDPVSLCTFSYNADILGQCVEAIYVNLHYTGFRLDFIAPAMEPETEETTSDIVERGRILKLLTYPNYRQSLKKLNAELEIDKNYTGGSYMEVVRNLAGEPAELHAVSARTMRISTPDKEPVKHDQWIRNEDGTWEKIIRYTNFRKYCQMVGGTKVWFKEFGDPRQLDKYTGEFEEEGKEIPFERRATEIIHDCYLSRNTIYGEPPWISELVNIAASNSAKSVNYLYFENRAIPDFVITVSGGYLGDKAVEQVKQYMQSHLKGMNAFHSTMVLEAKPFTFEDATGSEKATPVRIEIEPLTQFMQHDQQFQELIKNTQKWARESFRLPPLLIGGAEEYSHAATKEAKTVAEQQVFGPRREEVNDKYNRIIHEIGRNYDYVSLPMPIDRDTEIAEVLSQNSDLVSVGAGVDFIHGLLGVDPPQLEQEIRNMLIGEYRRSTTPTPTFEQNGNNGEEDGSGNEPTEDDDIGKQLVSSLKQLRKALTLRHR